MRLLWLLAVCVVNSAYAGALFGVIEPPPNPNRQFSAFKRQLLTYNAGKLLGRLKQNNASIKRTSSVIEEINKATLKTAYRPPGIQWTFTTGVEARRGVLFSSADYKPYSVRSEFFINELKYGLTLRRGPTSLNYMDYVSKGTSTIGVAYGKAW